MKNKFIILLIIAASTFAAQADAVVNDILLRRQGDNVNVRVNLSNPASSTQKGPVVVELFVRATESDPWTSVKVWNDITKIKAGNRVSRDYFDENNTVLKNLAAQGKFQAKATVKAPGVKSTEEKTSWYNTETGK